MICPRCHGTRHEPGVDSITDAVCTRCSGLGTESDQHLSPHFMLSELLVSEAAARRGLPNDPPDNFIERLRQVADFLELIRRRFGALHVNSGYRSPAVNEAIGGSPTSAHVQGWAADIVPLIAGVTLKQIMDWVIAEKLPYDQIIFEGTWVHISPFSPAGAVRREALMMFGGKYPPYDPADPRVSAA